MAWSGLPFGRTAAEFRLTDDLARLELLAPEALLAEASAAGLRAARAAPSDRAERLLDQARLLHEHGVRVGAPESLARAARAAEAALLQAPRARSAPEASLEGARIALDAAELAGDGALLDAAAARLEEVAARDGSPSAVRRRGLAAILAGRRALEQGETATALDAAARFDAATTLLARAALRDATLALDLARVRCGRAELLTAFALRLKDCAPAARAAADMDDLLTALDGDRTPGLWARTMRLKGEALTAEGELAGCPKKLADGSRALTAALAELPQGHAPVERARIGRALGHAARALADACDDPRAAGTLDAAAVQAFAAAEAELGDAGAVRLRAQLAFERAMTLAAAALRRPDAKTCAEAEAALRAELVRRDARKDPAAWAAVQVALARLYATTPDARRRAQAGLALESALEVFAEEGLRTLADAAAETLRMLKTV